MLVVILPDHKNLEGLHKKMSNLTRVRKTGTI